MVTVTINRNNTAYCHTDIILALLVGTFESTRIYLGSENLDFFQVYCALQCESESEVNRCFPIVKPLYVFRIGLQVTSYFNVISLLYYLGEK